MQIPGAVINFVTSGRPCGQETNESGLQRNARSIDKRAVLIDIPHDIFGHMNQHEDTRFVITVADEAKNCLIGSIANDAVVIDAALDLFREKIAPCGLWRDFRSPGKGVSIKRNTARLKNFAFGL